MATALNGTLLKGFSILSLFSEDRPRITATLVSKELGMNSATAHRFLTTLEEAGALISTHRGSYSLGFQLVELGNLAQLSNPLAGLVQPALTNLSNKLNLSTMASRMTRAGIMCFATQSANRQVSVGIKVGTVLEPHASAQGRIWLAYMSEDKREEYFKKEDLKAFNENTLADRESLEAEFSNILERGYSCNFGEREADIAAFAVPVLSASGKLIMTLSVFGLRSLFDNGTKNRVQAELLQTAQELKNKLYG